MRPTRIGEASATLIDNIWRTATPGDRLYLSGIVMSNITDHYSVFNVIEVEEAIVESAYIEINKRMLRDENMSILSERIRSYEWKNIERLNNIEEAYKEFNDNLKFMFDESGPNKTIKIKKLDITKPYITSEIKRLIRDKHRLQKLYNKKPITHGIEYRKLRNKLNKIIRNAKSNYFKGIDYPKLANFPILFLCLK